MNAMKKIFLVNEKKDESLILQASRNSNYQSFPMQLAYYSTNYAESSRKVGKKPKNWGWVPFITKLLLAVIVV